MRRTYHIISWVYDTHLSKKACSGVSLLTATGQTDMYH